MIASRHLPCACVVLTALSRLLFPVELEELPLKPLVRTRLPLRVFIQRNMKGYSIPCPEIF